MNKNQTKQSIETIRRAIELVGGANNLAGCLTFKSASPIYEWLANKRNVPLLQAICIDVLTDGQVLAEELRPDYAALIKYLRKSS